MCFSATGSFALSAVLTGAGVVGVATNTSPNQRLFAAIPFLFAAHQAAEGVVWLTFPPSSRVEAHRVATFAFLAVAMVLWPVWVSLSLRVAERRPARRRPLTAFVVVGVVVGIVSAILLATWPPVATIVGHSIRYDSEGIGGRTAAWLIILFYLTPTVGPFFVSAMPMSRVIGATLVASLILAFVVEREALTSVWCFFAAILSVQTLIALRRERRAETSPRPSNV
jgi:hypothetical protein